MTDESALEQGVPRVSGLNSRQRRVLGVLVEKAYTTPEYYPLTLKAVTTGCNQKSNRHPVVQFEEHDVQETLDQLGELGLTAVVHPESGRTERFRHLMRRRLTLSEPQLAILTELLLRGHQQLGELRSRAGRMVAIDTLDQLRDELAGLRQMELVQTSGPLERRGVEVDHKLYTDREQEKHALSRAGADDVSSAGRFETQAAEATPAPGEIDRLRDTANELRDALARLETSVADLQRDVEMLKRDLGVS